MVQIPEPKETDVDDVSLALEISRTQWEQGKAGEALKWLRKAANAALDADDEVRGIELSKVAAEIASQLPPEAAKPQPSQVPPPAAPVPSPGPAPAVPAPRGAVPPPAGASGMRPPSPSAVPAPASNPGPVPSPGFPAPASGKPAGPGASVPAPAAGHPSVPMPSPSQQPPTAKGVVPPPASVGPGAKPAPRPSRPAPAMPRQQAAPARPQSRPAPAPMDDDDEATREYVVPNKAKAESQTSNSDVNWPTETSDLLEVSEIEQGGTGPSSADVSRSRSSSKASKPAKRSMVPSTRAIRVAARKGPNGEVIVRLLDASGVRPGEHDTMLVALTSNEDLRKLFER